MIIHRIVYLIHHGFLLGIKTSEPSHTVYTILKKRQFTMKQLTQQILTISIAVKPLYSVLCFQPYYKVYSSMHIHCTALILHCTCIQCTSLRILDDKAWNSNDNYETYPKNIFMGRLYQEWIIVIRLVTIIYSCNEMPMECQKKIMTQP